MIGNLAADAEIKQGNGKEWLVFRLADTRKWKDANGAQHESTQWASCIMQKQENSNIGSYLKKGVKIFVDGDSDIEIYSSPKLRKMVARYNISVRSIELCGGSAEIVPRHLVVPSSGEYIDTYKAYFIDRLRNEELLGSILYGAHGGSYKVDNLGFVTPIQDSDNGESNSSDMQGSDNINQNTDSVVNKDTE